METTADVATNDLSIAKVDMKLEVVTIPVSDVDRATASYGRLGWRQDVTPPGSGVVQFTPPASGCSIQFGTNRTSAAPGGEYDVNWPNWYAAYMVAEQAGTELPT